ncbi:hypothetical protein ATO6_04210 [Oceanicola sp. 22II-s10i]|uniref:VOC family protein n=1 Tax=Oceanicola sp. 22II-s10i TaxID=1317116 RepID=UPI000B5227A3|nr:VOC family protein [Oceanicola sp. 22II-s10i]OWU86073.1 hypothetical protein ATO6_04210 [Oceanicola sp. 22II-s10i]
MAVLDHIVVVSSGLTAGLDHVERMIGVRPPPGGSHPLMGTHNHLVRLGEASFLEVISVDPDAPAPSRARWFGLDTPPAAPRLAHWVVRTDDMAALHPRLPAACGPAIPVTRGDLRWLLTVPEDGSLPEGGAFPSVLEWQADALPPTRMAGAGLDLLRLEIAHPEPERLAGMLEGVIDDPRVVVGQGPAPGLRALLSTPDGEKWLE